MSALSRITSIGDDRQRSRRTASAYRRRRGQQLDDPRSRPRRMGCPHADRHRPRPRVHRARRHARPDGRHRRDDFDGVTATTATASTSPLRSSRSATTGAPTPLVSSVRSSTSSAPTLWRHPDRPRSRHDRSEPLRLDVRWRQRVLVLDRRRKIPNSTGRRHDGDDDYEGQEAPDGVANIRVDQGWGSAQIMGAVRHIHDDRTDDGLGFAVGAGLEHRHPGRLDARMPRAATPRRVAYISSDSGRPRRLRRSDGDDEQILGGSRRRQRPDHGQYQRLARRPVCRGRGR